MTTSLDSNTLDISRDRLFFDQYRYGMRFRFEHSGRMRRLDHDAIADSVTWNNRFHFANKSWGEISQSHHNLMLSLCSAILSITQPYKRVVYTNWQYFYTNHPEIFADLAGHAGVDAVTYTEAQVDQPRDTVMLKSSDRSWRSYFRERVYTKDQAQALSRFLLARPGQFSITPMWHSRLQNGQFYINRSFFVDHDNQQDTLLLNLVIPGCVRKTLPIVARQ